MKAKTLMISLYLVVVLLFAGQTAAQGSIQLELDQGWNQISGSEPFQISELSEKCRIEEVAGQKVWGFYNGSWQHHDTLRPNLGYYVFAEASCTAEVPSVSIDSSLSVSGGWSMISRTGVDYWRECSTTSYQGNVAWRYSGNKWSHISNISSMNPLNGYWVNNKDRCRFKKGFSGSKFVILSDEATEQLDYEFKLSKKPEYIMEGSNKSGEDNDEITKLSEGYLVEGITGAGKGDSYKIPVSANISDFRVLNYPQDRYTLFMDGKKVDPGLYGAEDQDSGKEENYSFAAVKKGSKYEQNVDLPSCETSSSEVKIIDEESDWDAVKSEDYRVYCVEPGNYKDWGTKIIRSSGTSSEPKVFRATNIDNHPANEDSENLPTFSNLYITGVIG